MGKGQSASNKPCRTLHVVFGDQLDAAALEHAELDKGRDIVLMMEVCAESTHVASHVQRTVLLLSAMRHFAGELREDGWRVDYVELRDKANTQSFGSEIERAIDRLKPDRVSAVQPGEWRVLEMLQDACGDLELQIHEDPHFFCTIDDFGAWRSGRKELVMEFFYRDQRKKLGILMEDAKSPMGGAWNFDKENRKTFKSAPQPPAVPMFEPDEITRAVMEDVTEALPDLPGRIETFGWPVTRRQALSALGTFIQHRLPVFGDYQDAMWIGEDTLYHSVLSPAINLKLLNPREVVDAAVRAYERGDAPINCVEGFVRQLIGWREFIRGVYWTEGPDYPERNELGDTGSLPEFYWSGETDMACMKDAVRSVLDRAYGHHIARLMLTGNFAMMAGVDPGEVHAWYLGMYADAVEWATAPNTVGMALHADGGVVGTKPYAASGKYVKKMSNACKACRYDVNERTGENACPFNTFYWDFLIRHRERFSTNRRMSLMLKHVEKMNNGERAAIARAANQKRVELGISAKEG